MYRTNFTRMLMAAACMMLCGSAFAADEIATIDPNANAGTNASIPLISGGVGEDELNYLKSIQHEYDLKLIFTETNGVFLSDLPVSIVDKQGATVVSTVTKGPVLLVNLPAGSYTIVASREGADRKEKVSVSGHSLHTFQFRFPGNDVRSPEN